MVWKGVIMEDEVAKFIDDFKEYCESKMHSEILAISIAREAQHMLGKKANTVASGGELYAYVLSVTKQYEVGTGTFLSVCLLRDYTRGLSEKSFRKVYGDMVTFDKGLTYRPDGKKSKR